MKTYLVPGRRPELRIRLLLVICLSAMVQLCEAASPSVHATVLNRSPQETSPPDTLDTSHGDAMVRAYFAQQVAEIESNWLANEENLADWEARRASRKGELLDMLGLDPMPERTDLKPVVTGTIEHAEFTVEKLHFQSRPGLYVTANLYVPRHRDGRLPGVLYVCGHANRTENGVSYGAKTAYQRHAAWYARHGYVALIIDTIQLAEIEGLHHGTYREDRWWWWNRGYTPLGVETWNGVRALDYLASRPEVDPERLAVTGRSGGGIYSWTIAAVDDRVTATVPTAGITDLRNYVLDDVVTGHCDCMFMVNSDRWDFPMLSALVAPRPLLIANGDEDPLFPLDGVRRVFDRTREVYGLYDRVDRIDTLIVSAAHEDTPPLVQGTYEWMHRELKSDELASNDPAETLFDPADLKVFDQLPSDEINTRIDELFVPVAPEPPVPDRRSDWLALRARWMDSLRSETFAGWPTDTAPPEAQTAGQWSSEDLKITATDFESQEQIRLRAWTVEAVERPDTVVVIALDDVSWSAWLSILSSALDSEAEAAVGPGARAAVWPADDDEALEALSSRLASSRTALVVVAPRGIGPTRWTETERGYGIRRSHMLLGQTIEGMQAWDLLRAVRFARSLYDAPIALEASRVMAGSALYAALFSSGLATLSLHDLPQTHGEGPILLNVRKVFDLPQAVAAALEVASEVRVTRPPDWAAELHASGIASGTLTTAAAPWLHR